MRNPTKFPTFCKKQWFRLIEIFENNQISFFDPWPPYRLNHKPTLNLENSVDFFSNNQVDAKFLVEWFSFLKVLSNTRYCRSISSQISECSFIYNQGRRIGAGCCGIFHITFPIDFSSWICQNSKKILFLKIWPQCTPYQIYKCSEICILGCGLLGIQPFQVRLDHRS